jgi:hypothetical protein
MATPKKKPVAKKELVKELPSNNKEQAAPAQPPKPESFTISAEGTDELVKALNETVSSKYVKQVLFSVINENFKPNFPKEG